MATETDPTHTAPAIRPEVFAGDDPRAAEHFAQHGWVLTESLGEVRADDLISWIDEIADWPDDGGWLHHREMTDDGPKLCRSERLIEFHDGLRNLLCEGPLPDTAAALLGEPVALYKEKINYKLPGGAGYSAHQDAPAYPFVAAHVSAMVAVDDADTTNGCLEVVSGCHQALIPTDDRGCVPDDVSATLNWQPVLVAAGQTLWFHSLTPHRSGPNRSDVPRRALYPTYNARAEGELRTAYYDEKLRAFDSGSAVDNDVQVSLIADFEGRPVTVHPDDGDRH